MFSSTFRYALISLLELHQSLAGSNEAKVQAAITSSADLNRADVWLQTIGGRWSDELAATTLADLQKWSHNKSQP